MQWWIFGSGTIAALKTCQVRLLLCSVCLPGGCCDSHMHRQTDDSRRRLPLIHTSRMHASTLHRCTLSAGLQLVP